MFKGRRLEGPRRQGGERRTRPTAGVVRKALFDLLAPRIAGEAFLDLYAGTGAVALEALSRGAGRAVLVEHDPRVLPFLRGNMETIGAALEQALGTGAPGPEMKLLPMPADRALRRLAAAGERFDIIFADPPYHFRARAVIETVTAGTGLLAENGLFILQHHRDLKREAPFRALLAAPAVQTRAYGTNCLTFFRP